MGIPWLHAVIKAAVVKVNRHKFMQNEFFVKAWETLVLLTFQTCLKNVTLSTYKTFVYGLLLFSLIQPCEIRLHILAQNILDVKILFIEIIT